MDAGADASGCRGARCEAPFFPLPRVFLFPGQRMPLHVFEPRYRQMVQDLLDGPGRFVMGTVLESHADCRPGDTPRPVLPIGSLAEICHHEQLPDGRFHITIAGLARVHVREVPSARLYRRVEFELVHETPVCPSREELLREKLARAVLQRCRDIDQLPPQVPVAHLADLLLLRLQLPQSCLEPLFCDLDVERRALGALAEHARLRGREPGP